MAQTLSSRISHYVADAQSRDLPPLAVERAKHHLLDTLAAIVSGSRLEPGRQALTYIRSQGGKAEASVLGSRLRTSAVNAALANAMSAHADETDDSHPFSLTHPGSGVVPAALAMAERGDHSGMAFLKAVAVGYDICARTGMALGASDLRAAGKDCHAFGAVMGAAAAAASLAGLDARQCAFALSYASQQAAGLATLFREEGHTEKSFVFSGAPARDGVTAATMIQSGMTGVPDPFDGTPNFLGVHSVLDDPARAFRNLGRPLEITRTNIKRWSVGSPAQAVLDSVEALLAAQKISPDDIANVALRLTPRAALVVDGGRIQDINARHLAAVMLIDGTLTFASSHDTARLTDPAVAALRERIKVVPDETLPKEQSKREAIVDIVLRSGKTLRHRTRVVRGTTANPMSREEVETKALDLMAPVLDFNQTKSAIQAVRRIDGAGDVKKLVAALQIRA